MQQQQIHRYSTLKKQSELRGATLNEQKRKQLWQGACCTYISAMRLLMCTRKTGRPSTHTHIHTSASTCEP